MNWITDSFKLKTNVVVTGLTEELNILYILKMFKEKNDNVLVVVNSLYECNKIFSLLSTYIDDVLLFPMDDFLSSVALASSPYLKLKRL